MQIKIYVISYLTETYLLFNKLYQQYSTIFGVIR